MLSTLPNKKQRITYLTLSVALWKNGKTDRNSVHRNVTCTGKYLTEKQELQKAQEARQTVHANGSATAGATRSHKRPVATPVPKTAQTDTVIKPDMKRPATSPVIKMQKSRLEKKLSEPTSDRNSRSNRLPKRTSQT